MDNTSNPANQLSESQIDEQIQRRLAQLRADAQMQASFQNESDVQTDEGAYPVTFTGSGWEYFRIWIVNLFLTIVTLSLYSPWAKVRKMQYFYRNTHLDGATFDYHAQPKALLKGHLISLALLGLYYLSSSFSLGSLLAFGVLALVAAPWLMWQSLLFRLTNSSYRAVRFGFTGALKPAYWIFGAAITYILFYFGISSLAVDSMTENDAQSESLSAVLAIGGAMGLVPLLFPLWQSKLKHYQHSNYTWASVQSSFWATTGDFYKLWLKYMGVSIGLVFLFVVIVVIFSLTGFFSFKDVFAGNLSPNKLLSFFLMGGLAVLAYLALFGFLAAYLSSRLQNLVWNNTRTPVPSFTTAQIVIHSKLELHPLAGLMIKNLFLSAVTLGLYWPFAAIKLAKMKLEAITINTNMPLANVAAGAAHDQRVGALGDAAGDAFEVDIAL